MRYAAPVLLSVVGIIGLHLWKTGQALPAESAEREQAVDDWADLKALRQRGKDLDIEFRIVHVFHAKTDVVLEALAEGRLSLNDAAYRLQALGRECYPRYLELVNLAERGRTMHERVARNIVRHWTVDPESPRDLVERLQEELSRIVGEEARQARQSSL